MSTKRWLLDLIDAEEERVERLLPPSKRTGINYTGYNAEKLMIERARQLVEKGPDEP